MGRTSQSRILSLSHSIERQPQNFVVIFFCSFLNKLRSKIRRKEMQDVDLARFVGVMGAVAELVAVVPGELDVGELSGDEVAECSIFVDIQSVVFRSSSSKSIPSLDENESLLASCFCRSELSFPI